MSLYSCCTVPKRRLQRSDRGGMIVNMSQDLGKPGSLAQTRLSGNAVERTSDGLGFIHGFSADSLDVPYSHRANM